MKQYLPYPFLLSLLFIVFSCSSDSNEPTPPEPDVIAPSIAINIAGSTSSGSGETPVYSNQITVNINAQDANGVAKVEAFINDQKVGEDTTAPFEITIDLSGYTSKIPSSGKFQDYTLKIVATDTSGNQSSTEQVFNVDNELPFIANVTLQNGTIINGDTNGVSFEVTDNEGLFSIKAFMNNTLLQEFSTAPYELNVNTLDLTDGENTLRIEAVDLANNTATFDVVFVSDNTGPEITLESLVTGQIVDEPIQLAPGISDAYSAIASVEFLLGDASQVVFEGDVAYTWDLDPGAFTPGAISVFVKATDGLGNESSAEFPIEILRRLITINIPENFFTQNTARLYVFASDINGELLDIERIYSDTEMVRLHTTNETSGDFEYMLTFGEYISGSIGNASEFTTVQNIKPSSLPNLNLSTFYRYNSSWQSLNLQATGFDPDDVENLRIEGLDYVGGFGSGENGFKSEVFIQQRQNVNSTLSAESIYLSLENQTINQHSFAILDWEVPTDIIITPELFTTEGVERRLYQPIMNGESFESTTMEIYGYFTQDDFNKNIYNKTYSYGYGYLPSEGIPYFINTGFSNFIYNIRINDYFTERSGEPADTFTPVDWSIDYSFANNQFEISKSGLGHTIGEVYIDSESPEIIDGLNVSYRWSLMFDSQRSSQIKLPIIPEELQSWGFYSIYENGGLKVQQVEIKGYQGILEYDTYLEKVIQNHVFPYTISPRMESKFKSSGQGYYYDVSNFLFD